MNEDLTMLIQVMKYKIYEHIDRLMEDIVLCRDMEDFVNSANLSQDNILNVYGIINNINRSHDYPQEYEKCKKGIEKCLFDNKWDAEYSIARYLNFILEEFGDDLEIGEEEDYL